MKTKPNIILIITDQQRGDALGIDGHPHLMTPNIDNLAAKGTRFTKAYSSCPSCIAARRSILTGQSPATHGMVGFQEKVSFEPAATLPGELKKAGYPTYLVGRTMHQYPRKKRFGYDQMVLCSSGRAKHGISPNGWTVRTFDYPEAEHHTFETVELGIEFLEKFRDPTVPYFLTLSFLSPHPPISPIPFYYNRYKNMRLTPPVIGDWATAPDAEKGFGVDTDNVNLNDEETQSLLAGYYAEINYLDDQLFRFFNKMGFDPEKGQNNSENTIVIYTSDHGEMLGDHHLLRKTYPYEGSARIPYIISPSADLGYKSNNVSTSVVCLEDLMPTILDMADLPVPTGLDGKSLVNILKGSQEDVRDILHGEHADIYGPHQANHYLTDGQMKYIWYSQSGIEQLFDLSEDPQELNDLSQAPDKLELLNIWRLKLIEKLKPRPEGFTDGENLIAGQPHIAVVPDSNNVIH